jgi:hypothetical protein
MGSINVGDKYLDHEERAVGLATQFNLSDKSKIFKTSKSSLTSLFRNKYQGGWLAEWLMC